MKLQVIVAATFLPSSVSFMPTNARGSDARALVSKKASPLFSHRADLDTSQNDDTIIRAIECADNFGECSVDEMEDLKKTIHAKRMTAALTGADHISAAEETVALEQLLLEEDLELQLALLKDEMLPDSLSFLVDEEFKEQLLPGDEEDDFSKKEVQDMPLDGIASLDPFDFIKSSPLGKTTKDHLGVKLNTQKTETPSIEDPSFKSFITQGYEALMMDESGIPEELVICAAILLVAIIPHIIHF